MASAELTVAVVRRLLEKYRERHRQQRERAEVAEATVRDLKQTLRGVTTALEIILKDANPLWLQGNADVVEEVLELLRRAGEKVSS